MSKKSLDRKVAQKSILERRQNGKSDQEIYNELAQQYYDKKSIALLITGTATEENKAKYKIYNHLLLVLLGFSILLKLMTVYSLTLQTGQLGALLLVLIVPLFAGYFMFEIARYYGPIYRFCGLLTIAGFFQTIGRTENATDILINILFAGSVAALSFYIDSKMFPSFSPNKLKKDSNGEFILG